MGKYFALLLLCVFGASAYGQNGYVVEFTTTSTSPFQIKVNNLSGIPAHQVSVDMGNGIFSGFNAGNNIITINPTNPGNSNIVIKVESNSNGILLKSLEFITGSEDVTNIDLSKAEFIQQLVCEGAKISSLDVANKTKLDVLKISGCKNISTLDFTNTPNMVNFDAENCTNLTSINFGPVNDKLAYISVEGCIKLSSCDLSTVGGLEQLYGSLTIVSDYKISNCTKLTLFWAVNTRITSPDVSNNTKLYLLAITDNYITELDLSKNINLEWLYISKTHITEIDLSKNTKLTNLHASFCGFAEIDLTKNLDLKYLDVSDNSTLKKVILGNNSKLETLIVKRTGIEELNLSDCVSLKKAEAGSCEFLRELDFSASTVLEELDCRDAIALETLKINSTELNKLICTNAKITELDLSKTTKLAEFTAYNNRLKFSTITSVPGFVATIPSVNYDYQALVNIPTNIKINTVFTALKSEYLINGKTTTYTWKASGYTLVKGFDYTENNGEFTFFNVFPNLYCEMTNPEYPDLTLKTITTKTTAPNNLLIEFSINSDSQPFDITITAATAASSILIESDAGYSKTINISGAATPFTISPQGLNYKVYSVNNSIITGFTFNKITASLTKLDVSNALDLKTLIVTNHGTSLDVLDVSNNDKLERLTSLNNSLTSLDLTNNPSLEVLRCNQNKLTGLDLTNNPKITNIFCNDNQLTTLKINCPLLYLFECQNNKLIELDISKSTVLGQFNCINNRITSLNTTACLHLEVIRCSDNKLTNLVIGNSSEQLYIVCNNNLLQSLDLSSLTLPYIVEVRNNKLTQFTLGTVIPRGIYCENNYLKYSTLPELLMSSTSNKTYSPQNLVVIPKAIYSHIAFTNLVPEANVQANVTTYKWYTVGGTELVATVDYVESNGEFKFLKEITDSVYCTMTNPFYPNFASTPLTTTNTLIHPGCENKNIYMQIFDKMNTTIKAPDNIVGGFAYKTVVFKTPAEQGVKGDFTLSGGNLLFELENSYTIGANEYVYLEYFGETATNCYEGNIGILMRKLNISLVDSCSFNPRLVASIDHTQFDVIWEYSEDNITWSNLSVVKNISVNVTEDGYYRLTITRKGITPGSVDTRVGDPINIHLEKKKVANRYWYQIL